MNDQVRQPADHVQQRPFAGRAKMRHARLDEVAGDIKLVTVAQVGPAVLRLDELKVGVEVAVSLLSRRNFVDNSVEIGV